MLLDYVWLIPLFPLAGVLINAFLGRWLPRRLVAAIASLAIVASFAMAAVLFFQMLGLPAEAEGGGAGRQRIVPIFSWIVSGDFVVEANILLDPLSIVMALVVTGVSALIHIYSAGYMAGEEYHNRYFTWLNLFVFMMLILVLGDSFLTMYVGWEGVGLCSYLLIGYWFERESAANAAKKAFLVNRVGDFGLALGIMLIFATFGSVAFGQVLPAAASIPAGTATAIALLLFLGAAGKSAQIPLHVWLPDAMEGPTPVSALIHAATMVTAGVYMVARTHALFEVSLSALNWVMWIGALTAFLAATVALVQKDIKRVLAYSTISQLGYMFLALGAGAYAAAIFHLATHAFFKGLLFLGAGSVMHALSGELDIFKMGELRKKLPWTFRTFLIGVLALSGVPFFSGFFSKEAILSGAFEGGAIVPWLLGLVTAGLTAFYAFRVLFVAFYGKSRLDKKVERHVHESPWVMIVPMALLAVLAFAGGYIGLPRVLGIGSAVEEFLAPVFADSTLVHTAGEATLEWLLIGLSVVAVAAGILAAWWIYVRNWGLAGRLTQSARRLYDLAFAGYHADRAYMEAIVQPLRMLGEGLAGAVEQRSIDRAVNGVGELVGLAGEGLRRLQTGLVRNYALAMFLGVVAILAYFVLRGVLSW
ncbi:MAG: NADH-quinone oxidoreductase subunit L [Anaerolineae bacterium]|nr:NADH-quinone oxidoreductase subunit L [Anaerolineae bacterium]